jgi:hypothetical protein
MPIIVRCACGRQFRAPDAWAGKSARCPGCKAVLKIGQPAPRARPLRYEARPAARPPPGRGPAAKDRPVPSPRHPVPVQVPMGFVVRKYWYLYIPVISWLLMVFPLVLPFVPLGPMGLALSLAWSRRRMFPFYRDVFDYLHKPLPERRGFGRWFDNVCVNIVDLISLGLAQLLGTAALLGEMIRRDGTVQEKAEPNPLFWVLKWLLIGNALFLAAYVVCPGLLFGPVVRRIERFYLSRGLLRD